MTCIASSIPSKTDIDRVRREIRRLTCSAPWAERCWVELAANSRLPKRVDQVLDKAELYPPGGAPRRGRRGTLMRRCADCGVTWYPPQYIRRGRLCDDCAAAVGQPVTDEKTHVSSTSSPTAIALRDLAYFNLRLTEPRLPAEDNRSLRAVVANFKRRQKGRSSSSHPRNTEKHV